MRTWKNYLCMLAALVVTLGFTSCESDEDIGFDLSGLYGVTWFGDMGAGDSWGEPLDSYITFTSGSRPDHGVGTEDLYYTIPPFKYYDTYKFDWFIENGRLYIDYDTGESIIIDYPHVNGNISGWNTMEAAASKDKRISPNENNLSLSCKGVCQNCRLVRRGDGIARFSFGTLPLQFYFTTTLYPPVCPPNSGA